MKAVCENGHERNIDLRELETLLTENGPRDTPQWRLIERVQTPKTLTLRCDHSGLGGRHR